MIERRKPLKRSALKPPTLEQVQAFASKPRKAIAKTGRKAKRERPAIDAFAARLRERARGTCEAIIVTDHWRDICAVRTVHPGAHAHHVWPEDRDRGVHDPARGMWLCAASHSWAHAHPAEAAVAGLLRPDHDTAVT